jgi:PKD repeat protein
LIFVVKPATNLPQFCFLIIDFKLQNCYLAFKYAILMKLKHLLFASASSFFFFQGNTFAQSVKNYGCYTMEHNAELEQLDPQILKNNQAFENFYQNYVKQNKSALKTNGTVLKIPVVVHVVTEKGLNGIAKAQILNGIQVLNEDFRRTNADKTATRPIFQPYAADMEIEFVMARLDPNGQPTEGIDRVTSWTTNGPVTRDDVKRAAPAWPADKYFNVWLVQVINSDNALSGGTILGYAQFPDNPSMPTYGLVMLHNQWGKQGAVPGSTANSDGRTATHEVGHCFNLYHTFQGGCGNTNHVTSGDRCGDTPPSANDTYNCNVNQNTCSNDVGTGSPYTSNMVDQVENYMSYDNCQNMFTLDQKARSQAAFANYPYLQNLSSSNGASPSNAMVTGIDPAANVGPLAPQPYFGAVTDRVCAGETLTFQDASYNGAATSLLWSFPGGTPSTSTAANPTVTYTTPGRYAVTLTATNAAGARTYTVNDFVTVSPVTNLASVAQGQQYLESFEDSGFPNVSTQNRVWERLSNSTTTNTINWEQTGAASINGSSSLRIRNASIDNGTVSTLISPNINIAGISNIQAYFNLAYAAKNASPAELLEIYASNDCGKTWTRRYNKKGSQLVTNGGGIVGSFTPGTNDWRNEPILLTPTLLSTGHIMFKIEMTSKLGNTLYIDNFRLYTTLGTNDDLAENKINVYPNPVTTETGINFTLKGAEKVSVKIFDLVGNCVYNGTESNLTSGSHTIDLYNKMKVYKAGMYMVQLNIGNKVYNTKLIAQ